MTTDAKPRVGWVGTGVMGAPMCGHLLARGYRVAVHTRNKAKAQALLDSGATWASTPGAVGQQADIVFTIVGLPREVREVYFGEQGLLAAARPGQAFVDMTTTEPTLAREIYDAARAKGAAALDAPVSGGDVGARNATLSIMIGGDRPLFDKTLPLLEAMGKRIVYQGGAGAGQHTKMSNQIVISGTMIGVCESLLYAHKAGLSLDTMLDTIRGGAAACWALDNLAPRIVKRDFAPGFFVEHFIKDMGIALAEAERMGIALPGLALVHQLYVALRAQGHGRSGTQALMLALESISATGPAPA
ncbi:MAG: NAD(P)-dependent oxidoreductase [Gemmatimonadetes bacterium]|nr:NAD(P)-dependent oxidoreductase [Gemmatimonadota bacterium]